MLLPGLLVGFLASATDRLSFTIVALVWRYMLDAAVAMFRVVPVHKSIGPGPNRQQVAETPQWIARDS
jgi:hypothetical protein